MLNNTSVTEGNTHTEEKNYEMFAQYNLYDLLLKREFVQLLKIT